MLRITKISDSKIITYIREGGRKENLAIQALLNDNRTKIKALILKNKGNENDAESILIEGVTAVVFNIRKDKFKGGGTLGTYLYSICRNLWLKSLKKNSRFVDAETNENLSDEVQSPLDSYNDQQIKDILNFLTKRLGDSCREVLRLWALHYSMTEIANQLGYKNAQIAMNKKSKCMTKLKEMVKKSPFANDLLMLYQK